jgi:hypothetical protein
MRRARQGFIACPALLRVTRARKDGQPRRGDATLRRVSGPRSARRDLLTGQQSLLNGTQK